MKTRAGKARSQIQRWVIILNKKVSVSLTYEITFEQRLKEGKG